MSEKTNGVSLLVSDNHITVNADITFAIEERADIPAAHISDVIYQLVLDGLRKHEGAKLGEGSYKGVLTLCVSSIPSSDEEGISDEELASMEAAQGDEADPEDEILEATAE
jgi:hypothetical protein